MKKLIFYFNNLLVLGAMDIAASVEAASARPLLHSLCSKHPIPIQVELDLFSGRENYKWILSETERHALCEQLQTVQATTYAKVPDSILGYRGFVLTPLASSDANETCRVHKGLVWWGGLNSTEIYADQNNQVEQLLLTSSYTHIPSSEYPVFDPY